MSVWLIRSWFGLFGFKTLLFVNLKRLTDYMNMKISVDVQSAAKSNLFLRSDVTDRVALICEWSDHICTGCSGEDVGVSKSGLWRGSFDQSSRFPNNHKSRSRRRVSAWICCCLRCLSDLLDCTDARLSLWVCHRCCVSHCKRHKKMLWHSIWAARVSGLGCIYKSPQCGYARKRIWAGSLNPVLVASYCPGFTPLSFPDSCKQWHMYNIPTEEDCWLEYLHESTVIKIPVTAWEGGENNQH